jgi:esterase/lipase superfamily enzyme
LKEEHVKWYSPTLGRETEMLIFGHAGQPVIIYPTSMGSYHQNRDFHLIDAVSWFVDNGLVKIYCPDSVDKDSFYDDQIHPAERIRRHNVYDQFIMEEVVSRATNETGHQKVTVAGCSFGGYHAINFAFRHPHRVSGVFSMGGAFDIRNHLDGYYDDQVFYNNPVDFLPDLQDENLWKMQIVLGVGEHDFCLPQNNRLAEIMSRKGMPFWMDIRPGAEHDWPVWREMLPTYFSQMVKQ